MPSTIREIFLKTGSESGSVIYSLLYPSSLHPVEIHRHRTFQTVVERIGNERMAYGDFVGKGNARNEITQIIEIQVMPGIESETEPAGFLRCRHIIAYGRFRVRGIRRRIPFRIEFHPVGTAFSGPAYHLHIGIDEY